MKHPQYPYLEIPSEEAWKSIPGYEGVYDVSSLGRVRSRPKRIWRNPKGWHLVRSQIKRKSNHYRLSGRLFKAHRLVLLAFVGPCPKGMEGCHWDGNPHNNRLENLRWDTHTSNEADKVRHGTNNALGRNGAAKLSIELVRNLRALYMTGKYSYSKLSEQTGIPISTFTGIMAGKTWNRADCFPEGFVPFLRTPTECFKAVNRWTGQGCKR